MKNLVALLLLPWPTLAGAADWRLVEGPVRWEVAGTLDEKLREDISGAAWVPGGIGLIVSDEARGAQRVEIDPAARRVTIRQEVELDPVAKNELDLEAVALSSQGDAFYLLGSHSLARKTAKQQLSRCQLFKLPTQGGGRDVRVSGLEKTSLRDLFLRDPFLADALDRPLDLAGLDLEGVAEKDGVLFIGLRGPLMEGGALVLEADAARLMASPARVEFQLHRLQLGPNLGVRELVSIKEGFLILGGASPTDESADGFFLFHWPGPGAEAARIAAIPNPPGKAEGLLVLSETAADIEILLFFDGVENGAPTWFKLARP